MEHLYGENTKKNFVKMKREHFAIIWTISG